MQILQQWRTITSFFISSVFVNKTHRDTRTVHKYAKHWRHKACALKYETRLHICAQIHVKKTPFCWSVMWEARHAKLVTDLNDDHNSDNDARSVIEFTLLADSFTLENAAEVHLLNTTSAIIVWWVWRTFGQRRFADVDIVCLAKQWAEVENPCLFIDQRFADSRKQRFAQVFWKVSVEEITSY